jgi:hypothetical protein
VFVLIDDDDKFGHPDFGIVNVATTTAVAVDFIFTIFTTTNLK